jgi:hypothetical protein
MTPPVEIPAHKLLALLDLANLIGLAAIVILVGAGLTATIAIARAVFPNVAAGLDDASSRRSRWRRFAIGLLNGPALLFLGLAFSGRPATKPIGVVLLFALAFLMLAGLTAEVPRLGRRLLLLSGRAGTPLAHVAAGGGALTAAFLVPVLGWALFASIVVLGIGSAVSWLFTRRRSTASDR